MIIRIIAGAGALVWMSAISPVLGADIPARPIVKAPVQAPAYSWYGFFIGVQGGYGWGHDPVAFSSTTPPYLSAIGTTIPLGLADNARGGTVGVTYGSNWQLGQWVIGTISDFSWSDIRRSEALTLTSPLIPIATRTNFAEQRMRWFSTTRARVGYLIADNVLLYGSGGLATGDVEVTVANTAVGVPCAVPGACPAGSFRKTRWGWAAGGGLEYAAGPWIFNVEYLHYDLGTQSFLYGDGVSPALLTASTKFSGDMVRGAISYKFNWTPWGLIFGTDRL
jgi:outer membrane immunogenic protein